MTELQTSDVFSFVAERQAKFAQHLRTKGVDLPHANNHSVYRLSDASLALDAPVSDEVVADPKAYSITLPITTVATDRYGDVVVPKGCMPHLKNYEKNPVVFFSHKSTDLPIGLSRTPLGAVSLRFFDDKVVGTGYLHEETEEARAVGRLCMLGVLKAASIGFKPVVAALLDHKESKKNRKETDEDGNDLIYFDGWAPLKFNEWDLLEWSIVPIPANQECIAEHLFRGKIDDIVVTDTVRRMLTPYAAPLKGLVLGADLTAGDRDPVGLVTETRAGADPGDEDPKEKDDVSVEEVLTIQAPKDWQKRLDYLKGVVADMEKLKDTAAAKVPVVKEESGKTPTDETIACIYECATWLKENLIALSEQNAVSHSVILAALDTMKPADPEKAVEPEPTPTVIAAAQAQPPVAPEPKSTPPVDPAVVAALQSLVAANQKIQDQFHRLTGKKV